MKVWNVLQAARWKYRTQKNCQKSPTGLHRTTLWGYIFATKAHIDNRKKLLSNNASSTSPQNMANFGPLTSETGWPVWGTPANFNWFRVLAALLHGIYYRVSAKLCGVEQRAPPIIRQGDHHVGHWPTFLVHYFFVSGLCYPLHNIILTTCLWRWQYM